MLLELNISNFALIDSVSISLEDGLNILTGETGAGKSIIIDAVNVVLGDRADTDIIRTGTDRAMIEALFDCSGIESMGQVLFPMGIELGADRVVVMSREIKSGRSISRVNGRTVPLSCIREISKHLIDIHGQHQHQSLLDVPNHLEILDQFGGEQLLQQRNTVADMYRELDGLMRSMEEITADEMERQRNVDLFSYQVREIDAAGLKAGEDEELSKRRQVMVNSEKIYQSLAQSYRLLYEGDDMMMTVIEGLNQVDALLSPFAQMDSSLQEFYGAVNSSYLSLKEVARDIRDYIEGIEFNQQALDMLEERLDLINKLKRKYGNSIEEILAYRDNKAAELSRLENSERELEDIKRRIQELEKDLERECDILSGLRRKASGILEKNVTEQVKKLGMENGNFNVKLERAGGFSLKGADTVEFMFSANLGEPLKPLNKIASGGEMSRIMLAIKTSLAHTDRIPTLIFDEIDAGISGRTAQVVAQQLAEASQRHQVICVTHLPQIASMADNHYLIKKEEDEGHTYTRIQMLDDTSRVQELARLLGGAKVTQLTLNHAREMLNMAKNFKKALI